MAHMHGGMWHDPLGQRPLDVTGLGFEMTRPLGELPLEGVFERLARPLRKQSLKGLQKTI